MKLEYEFVRRIAKQIGLDIEKSKIFDIWKKKSDTNGFEKKE